MKNKILLLIFLFAATKAIAQIPVTDVAANGNLVAMNTQLNSIRFVRS